MLRNFTRYLISFLQACISAFQFLTRLPIPISVPFTEITCRRSVVFFPAAGMMIGLILLGSSLLLQDVFSMHINAVLILIVWIMITGGLHLDGLMDTADGVLSHRSREKMLEIMKDSRVGAMGVIVCVVAILLKYTLLFSWIEGIRYYYLIGLFLIPVWSRWFLTIAIYKYPYARNEGFGSYYQSVKFRHVILATVLALIFSTIGLHLAGFDTISTFYTLLIVSMTTYCIGWMISTYLYRKLGGLTGDTYGALNELIEILLLLIGYGVIRVI